MKRKFIIWSFCALWTTSLIPLWNAKANLGERNPVNLVDSFDSFAEVRDRAVAATEEAFEATWKRVDDTIHELFRSAPNIDE